MRSANQDQMAGSIFAEEYLGISSARCFRKDSVLKSLPAKPMMANCLESRLPAARLQSAGMSLRLVKSPVAPKMTMTQGDATGFVFAWFMRSFWSGFLFGVTAELKAHSRQNFGGEFTFASRQKALIERFAQHGSGGAGFNGGENGPAAFAGIGDAAGETVERGLLEKRNSGKVE